MAFMSKHVREKVTRRKNGYRKHEYFWLIRRCTVQPIARWYTMGAIENKTWKRITTMRPMMTSIKRSLIGLVYRYHCLVAARNINISGYLIHFETFPLACFFP